MPPKPRPLKKKQPARKARRSAPKKSSPNSIANCQTATPHLICAGAADALDFYIRAFGAKEEIRIPAGNGKLMHAAFRLGNSTVMLADEMPDWGALSPKALKGSPVTIHLVVPDVDAFVARAVKAGAQLTMPVADMFWGDRYGKIRDPFGHDWSVATPIRTMTNQEMIAAAPKFG